MKRIAAFLLVCILLIVFLPSCGKKQDDSIPYWKAGSPAVTSLISFIASATDEESKDFIPEDKRIAVFDMDGTLYGELFPTYFDESLLLHRLLHDESYHASEEDLAWAKEAEEALLGGQPEPDSPRSGSQMAAEAFKGFTVEEYRDYVRGFMKTPVAGFENMTYGEGFYLPMVELLKYLSEHGFTVFISSESTLKKNDLPLRPLHSSSSPILLSIWFCPAEPKL